MPVLREALPILEASFASDNAQLAAYRYRLGVCYRNLGRYREAEPMLTAALGVMEKLFGSRHLQTASALLD